MSTISKTAALAVTLLAAALPATVSTSASAGDICEALWYQRNFIYANAGHCFKTEAGRAEFGTRCRAPYGRLTAAQQRKVNGIRAQERKYGC